MTEWILPPVREDFRRHCSAPQPPQFHIFLPRALRAAHALRCSAAPQLGVCCGVCVSIPLKL